MTNLIEIKKEINAQLGDSETFGTLVATTFNGLNVNLVKRAIMEGMMRGFSFKDFLEKNVYAIPFRDKYSLVTSIDYARKLGMRSGVVGKSEPVFEEKDGNIVACTITVKRKIAEYIGDYTAKVYFSEYSTGKNLWATKPRTMIAKVAEMHALRMACPEEMAKVYTEEEMEKETVELLPESITEDLIKKVKDTTTEAELRVVWEENKGLGKEFAKIVTEHRKFIKSVNEAENDNKTS